MAGSRACSLRPVFFDCESVRFAVVAGFGFVIFFDGSSSEGFLALELALPLRVMAFGGID